MPIVRYHTYFELAPRTAYLIRHIGTFEARIASLVQRFRVSTRQFEDVWEIADSSEAMLNDFVSINDDLIHLGA